MNPRVYRTHRFWRFFIDHYRVTYLLLFAVVIFGILAIFRLPKESAPEVDIPVGVVTTTLPGAGAESVEELVTEPIEDGISGLADVSSFTSTSEQGISTIMVEFDASGDTGEKIDELRSRVDRAASELPRDAGMPQVQQISFSDQPILTMALSGPLEPSALKPYAEELSDEFEGITGVSRVTITGAPEQTIEVEVDSARLNQYSISLGNVIAAISDANTDLPIGAVETAGRVYTLRLDSRFSGVEDVENTPISGSGGALISVADVADVSSTFSKQDRIARFSAGQSEPRSTISLQLFKESGEGNILSITDEAKSAANELVDTKFPTGVGVEVVRADADVISSDLKTLSTSGVFTVLIIVLVLAAFLGWREALLASIVVPTSFLIAFIGIFAFSLTINFLTLFSLILSLGILVDAAIVVTESIFRKRMAGESGIDASMHTIDEFQAPLVAGTLTTVFVFLPMLLTSGIIGEFIVSIPITVSIVLLASLFVGLGIVTTLATRLLKTAHHPSEKGFLGARRVVERLYERYGRALEKVVLNKRRSYFILGIIAAAFAVSVSLPFAGVVAVNMFPLPDSDTIYVDVEAPAGTPLSETDGIVRGIEKRITDDPRVESFLTVIGQDSRAGSIDIASAANSHIASLTLTLADDRAATSRELVAEYEELFADTSGAEVTVFQPEGGPEQGRPVQIKLFGDDLAITEETARQFAGVLAGVEGTRNVESGVQATAGELSIDVNRNAASDYGVTPAGIAAALRTAVSGSQATDIKRRDDNISVVVSSRFPETGEGAALGSIKRVDISGIRSLPITTARGNVSLDTFADIKLVPGRSGIAHEDGERLITVSSQVEPGANAAGIVARFREDVESLTLPAGVTVSYGGETEDIAESFTDLAQAMVLGVLAIFTLMVWQFRSYRQPLFILITVPLALTGVFLGLALVRQPLSFPGFIGIVALSGVVVNNAIILIDAINSQRSDEGKDISRAVIDGARSRLEPVILTTLTTVTGLLPLALTQPTWSPVAYSIIFGLLFATVLTLFVVPILYSRFADKKLER